MNEHQAPMEYSPEMSAEQQALHVLTMAQRTAEEHLAQVHRQADQIRGEAQEQAANIIRDAQARAEHAHREAERIMSEARAGAAQIAEDARAQAEAAQHEAQRIVGDAQLTADDIANNAQAEADDLAQLAKQRYEDVVGSLATRREGLQQQIEALERFDREYRGRLQAFMQNQMRALWFDDPQVEPEALGQPEAQRPPIEAGELTQPAPTSASASVPVPRGSADDLEDDEAEQSEHEPEHSAEYPAEYEDADSEELVAHGEHSR